MSETRTGGSADRVLDRLVGPFCFVYLFLLVTLFVPFGVWSPNRAELVSGFQELLPFLLQWKPGVALLGVGIAAAFLPRRQTRVLTGVVFTAILFAHVELSFFRGETGLIGAAGDGVQVDTTSLLARILTFAAILGLVFLMRREMDRLVIAVLGGMVLVSLLQMVRADWTHERPSTPEGAEARDAYLDFATFSRDQNVVHIILDEFQSSFFEQVARSEFPDYRDRLDGFVFYRNHLGLYPNTHHSMHSLFQNRLFYNEVPTVEWVNQTSDDSIFDDMTAAGVAIDILTMGGPQLQGKAGVNLNLIPVPYVALGAEAGSARSSARAEAELLREVALAKLVPNPLHGLLVRRGGERGGRDDADSEDGVAPPSELVGDRFLLERHISHAEVLRDWGLSARAGRGGVVYKQLHTLVTHNPAALNADCSRRERSLAATWENMRPQATCALGLLFDFLDRLDAIGVYDNSTIVIHADHGKRNAWRADAHLEEFAFGEVQEPPVYDFAFSRVVASAMPVLLAKQRGARHPLKVSNAPTSFADIAPTLMEAAGVAPEPGQRTVFEIEESEARERLFFYYHYTNRDDPYVDRLSEYRVNGPVWDPDSWHEAAVHVGPHSDFATDRIDMGAFEFRHHERGHWLQGRDRKDRTKTVAYTIGPVAEIEVDLQGRADRVMTVNMQALVGSQVLDVELNGTTVASLAMGKRAGDFADYRVRLPGGLLTGTPDRLNVVAFRPRKLKTVWRPEQQRIRYGVGIDWIAFELE